MFNDANDFFETSAQGGKAYRFKDIDGIGPATAKKIKNVRLKRGSVQNPEDVADMSADELSDKAGISRDRASKAIKAGGGNPNQSKQSNTGSVSAAGIQQAQGDFMVGFSELDKARARNDVQSRSEEAVRQDDQKRAPVTTNYDKWKQNPGRWDFPGVDTPTQNPNLLPKDLKAGNPDTTDFEARDEREQERKQQSFPQKKDAASGKSNFILQTEDERIPASDVNEEVPSLPGFAPGVAPNDFEDDGFYAGERGETMGFSPSSQRLPEPIKQGLASGEEADVSFLGAEQDRSTPDTGLDTMLGSSQEQETTTQDTGKPEFREPNIGMYNTGDQFSFTYESDRAGTGLVSHTGTVVQNRGDYIEVDVGNSNFFRVFSTGRVVSISDNYNESLVGYTVFD